MARYSNDKPVFGVHFTFPVLAGRELYTQPLTLNDNQPELISFNKFSKIEPRRFNPQSPPELEAYFMEDQNGYLFHNQYPGPRADIPIAEGNRRFNLGTEYPWYQRNVKDMVINTQYEYTDLEFFLLRCSKGFLDLDAVLNDINETLEKRKRAATKGKALYELYHRILKEFKATYPEYSIEVRYADDSNIVLGYLIVKNETTL